MSSPLPTQLREAAAGSRELDAAMHEAITTFRPRRAGPGWKDENELLIPVFPGFEILPAYTSDLNAITALVEARLPRPDYGWGVFSHGKALIVGTKLFEAEHKSPALALCLALLSAAEGGSDG